MICSPEPALWPASKGVEPWDRPSAAEEICKHAIDLRSTFCDQMVNGDEDEG